MQRGHLRFEAILPACISGSQTLIERLSFKKPTVWCAFPATQQSGSYDTEDVLSENLTVPSFHLCKRCGTVLRGSGTILYDHHKISG